MRPAMAAESERRYEMKMLAMVPVYLVVVAGHENGPLQKLVPADSITAWRRSFRPRSGARGALHPNGSRGFSSNEVLRVHGSTPTVSRNLIPRARGVGGVAWFHFWILGPI